MKSLLLLLTFSAGTASAQVSQQALDSIAARYVHGFLTINYDSIGKPDIDTVVLRVYDQRHQEIVERSRAQCSCNPFNIARRIQQQRYSQPYRDIPDNRQPIPLYQLLNKDNSVPSEQKNKTETLYEPFQLLRLAQPAPAQQSQQLP